MLFKSLRSHLVPAQAGSPGQQHIHSCAPDAPPRPPGDNPPGDSGGGGGGGGCANGQFFVLCRPQGAGHDASNDYPMCVDCGDTSDPCAPDSLAMLGPNTC